MSETHIQDVIDDAGNKWTLHVRGWALLPGHLGIQSFIDAKTKTVNIEIYTDNELEDQFNPESRKMLTAMDALEDGR